MRSRRTALGLTQDKLARALGLTFQQIQKYEKGTNRIGAGRLQAISRILEAPVSYFYSDGPTALAPKLADAQRSAMTAQTASAAEGLKLIREFMKIEDAEARAHLIGLANALARKPVEKERD